jgi:hypothetical protein
MKKILYSIFFCSLLFAVSSCKKTDGEINPLSSLSNFGIGSYLVLDKVINTSLVYETAATSKVGVMAHAYTGAIDPVDHVDLYAAAGNTYDTTKWKFVKTIAIKDTTSTEISATGGDLAKALGVTAASFKAGSGYSFYIRLFTKKGARYDVNNTGTNGGSGILGGPSYNTVFNFSTFIVCGYTTNMAGTYTVIKDEWEDSYPGDEVVVKAGPKANQLDLSAVWPGGSAAVVSPLIIDIDPATGAVSLPAAGISFEKYASGSTYLAKNASGYAFACTGTITVKADVFQNGSAYIGRYEFIIKKK